MKNYFITIGLFLLQSFLYSQTSPDYIFGDGNGAGWSWTSGTQGSSSLGSSFKWQFQATTNTNQYFKFGETSSNANGSGFWMNNASGDLQYTGAGAVWNSYYSSNMGSNGAIYFSITSGKYYVVKAKKDPSSTNAYFSIMELTNEPVSISNVTDAFISAGTAMTVKITLSSSKSSEEKIFVRYTTDNWSTSSITSEATGSGTSYAATIPASGVTATTNNQYYVFTTTVSSPSTSEADILTINYNNNSGNNFSVFSKFLNISLTAVQSGKGFNGPWMFNINAPYFTYMGSCNSYFATFAYGYMEWNTAGGTNTATQCTDGCTSASGSGVVTSSSCTQEQTNILSSTSGITVALNRLNLAYFNHINTVNPNSNWNTNGEAGDQRIYVGNGGTLKVSGVTKLAFGTTKFFGVVRYPSPYGAGTGITGNGWAEIDASNSDALWVTEFDPYGTGQVEFEGTSFSSVLQNCYGTYNWDFKLKPSSYQEYLLKSNVGTLGNPINVTLNFTSCKVSLNFISASGGGPNGDMDTVMVNYLRTAPGGILPSGIDAMAPLYWRIGTLLDTFTTHITFDMGNISGISNTANLRILKRDYSSSSWSIYADYTLVDATHIRANNVTDLSEWTIGSTSGNQLPVEISRFELTTKDNSVNLNWETKTEVNSYKFEIERQIISSKYSSYYEWTKIGEVFANGNSYSPKIYNFVNNYLNSGKYKYRLKLIDNDNSFQYSNEIEVTITAPRNFELYQNYPNPFNPITKIDFDIPSKSKVNIDVFNVIGEKVAILLNEVKEAGSYSINFDANNLESGVYFYRLTTEKFLQVKKMAIVK